MRPRRTRANEPLTAAALDARALRYLSAVAASTARLRDVLRQEVRERGADLDVFADDIDAIVAKYTAMGALDDARIAESSAAAMRASGKSASAISARLRARGIDADTVDAEVTKVTRETDDLAAAMTFARKRGIGPFRASDEARKAHREKDLATLGRAGYGYAVAKRVIDHREE